MPYIFTPSWDVSWIPVLLQFKIRCFSFPLSLEEYTFLCKHTNLCPICARSRTTTSQFNFYVQPLFPAPPDSYLFLNLSLISAPVPYEPHSYIYKKVYICSKVYKKQFIIFIPRLERLVIFCPLTSNLDCQGPFLQSIFSYKLAFIEVIYEQIMTQWSFLYNIFQTFYIYFGWNHYFPSVLPHP